MAAIALRAAGAGSRLPTDGSRAGGFAGVPRGVRVARRGSRLGHRVHQSLGREYLLARLLLERPPKTASKGVMPESFKPTKTTPARAREVADNVWTLEELLSAAAQ